MRGFMIQTVTNKIRGSSAEFIKSDRISNKQLCASRGKYQTRRIAFHHAMHKSVILLLFNIEKCKVMKVEYSNGKTNYEMDGRNLEMLDEMICI